MAQDSLLLLLIVELQTRNIATHYRLVPGQVITKINNLKIVTIEKYH